MKQVFARQLLFYLIKCFIPNKVLFAGSNRTGVAAADASHGKEQETHGSGRLYRFIAVTRDRMFSATASESVSEAIIIPRKPIDQ